MAVEYESLTSSSSTMADTCIKESKICKNNSLRKAYHKNYHYICLGALIDILQVQNRKGYSRRDNIILTGVKYIEDIHRWTQQNICNKLFADEFMKSVFTSVVLFAIGMKLTNELAAWRVL